MRPVVLQDGSHTAVYGLGLIATTDASGTQTYHLGDGLGSTTALTDGSGNLTATFEYDVFGAVRQQTGTADSSWRFTGEVEDPSGLYYLRARVYDPSLGRFLTRDAFEGMLPNPQTLNRYAYAINNPTLLTDPSGHIAFLALVAIGWAVFEIGSSVLDAYTTAQTLADPNASTKEKAATASLFAAGLLAPGGGYATGGKLVLRSVARNVCSFSGETLVATADGAQPIESLKVGDRVLAYDEATGTTGTYTITAVWVHEDATIETVTLAGEGLETTPEHPFFVADKGWVAAGELEVGDWVRRADGGYDQVEAIGFEQRPQRMYNLTVDQAHTFFVGDGQWLVHNTCRIVKGQTLQDLVAAAQRKYPGKAGKIEYHHEHPKYLGGDPKGQTAPLDAAYHQEITNAIRERFPFGNGPFDQAEVAQFLADLYRRMPLR